MSEQAAQLKHNQALNQFELRFDEGIALVAYKRKGDVFNLLHTEVPESLEGKGIASQLVERVLSYLKSDGFKIIPSCCYVRSYLMKHPQWNELVTNIS